jgi:integrase
MPATITAAPADEPGRRKKARKSVPKLRDGVMKRGSTWSYVIRVKDPETGISKPRWVGGFADEEAAKAARDESRVKARRGEYIDRSRVTVTAYLDDWIDGHAMEIKPRTLMDYRACIRLYVTPHIGNMPIQAVRPSTITKLYRDLLTSGGRDGGALAVTTVIHLHAVLRKAFRDAMIVDELIGSNPVERAKRPRAHAHEPGTVWTVVQLQRFLSAARQHRLSAFFHVAAYTGARRGELLNLRWTDIDLDAKKITITGSTAVIGGERINGTTKSGRTRPVSIDDETIAVLRQHRADQAAEQLKAGDSWHGVKDGYVFTTGWGEPVYPDTVGWLMTKLIRAYNAPQDGPEPAEPLPHARVHDLRHIHATTLLLAGVPVHVVAARLGHADPAITLRVYAHIIRSAETAAAEVFARVWPRPPDAVVSKPVSKRPFPVRTLHRKGPFTCEPPIGIEPMTYALRVRRSSRLS